MAIKTWIDEIKTAESGQKSEAQLSTATAPPEGYSHGEKAADQIIFQARDRIVLDGVFHFTPETQAAEMAVNQTYQAILAGGNDFTALRAACVRWIEAASKAPLPPETISIFNGSR